MFQKVFNFLSSINNRTVHNSHYTIRDCVLKNKELCFDIQQDDREGMTKIVEFNFYSKTPFAWKRYKILDNWELEKINFARRDWKDTQLLVQLTKDSPTYLKVDWKLYNLQYLWNEYDVTKSEITIGIMSAFWS